MSNKTPLPTMFFVLIGMALFCLGMIAYLRLREVNQSKGKNKAEASEKTHTDKPRARLPHSETGTSVTSDTALISSDIDAASAPASSTDPDDTISLNPYAQSLTIPRFEVSGWDKDGLEAAIKKIRKVLGTASVTASPFHSNPDILDRLILTSQSTKAAAFIDIKDGAVRVGDFKSKFFLIGRIDGSVPFQYSWKFSSDAVLESQLGTAKAVQVVERNVEGHFVRPNEMFYYDTIMEAARFLP